MGMVVVGGARGNALEPDFTNFALMEGPSPGRLVHTLSNPHAAIYSKRRERGRTINDKEWSLNLECVRKCKNLKNDSSNPVKFIR